MSGYTYIHGLAASVAPRRAASLELGSILAARRGAIRARLSVHKSPQALRRVAVRRVVNQALLQYSVTFDLTFSANKFSVS